MRPAQPRILIAAPSAVFRRLERILSDDFEVVGAETFEQAVTRLEECDPAAIVVCYVFDEMRPFRFLQYVRNERRGRHIPTSLVRAVPIGLGRTQEDEIR